MEEDSTDADQQFERHYRLDGGAQLEGHAKVG